MRLLLFAAFNLPLIISVSALKVSALKRGLYYSLKRIKEDELYDIQIIHLDRNNIPNYQWSAIDVKTYLKLIASSRPGIRNYMRKLS